MIGDAERHHGIPAPEPAADAAADLAGHAIAVLAAYRELTQPAKVNRS